MGLNGVGSGLGGGGLRGLSFPYKIIFEDFEDGDLAEYPSLSQASITTGTVFEGSNALQFDTDGNSYGFGASGVSGPKPGGETFECHFYITAQKDWPAITFGVQSDYSGGAQRNYNNVSLRGDLRLAVDSNQLDSTNVDKSTGFVVAGPGSR